MLTPFPSGWYSLPLFGWTIDGDSMKARSRIPTALGILALSFSLASTNAFPQPYPTKPIRLVVPYSAGSTDTLARLIAVPMSAALGEKIIVENKPGAGGAIGGDAVAKSVPDGYTLCFCGMAPALVLSLMDPKLPYKPADLAPVGQIVNIELILVTRADFDAATLPEFISKAKANPGKINYGAAGYGSSTHLTGELFKRTAGVEMPFVLYKGDQQLVTDLMGGQIDAGFATIVAAAPQVRAGRIKAIGVTGTTRSRALPDVPTLREQGLSSFSGDAWGGLNVAAGTPPAIIKTLNDALVAALKDSTVQERMVTLGVSPVGSGPEAYGEFLRRESEKWSSLIREAGIKNQ
jgi:tripartite-type tricarboxylate transporter receptor subunit TctC